MADYFSPNLDILAKKNPSLAKAIFDAEPDGSFEILRSESGHYTIRQYVQEGKYRFIHSNVNPRSEALTWMDCQHVDRGHAVILGVGLAYHVAELRLRFLDCRSLLLMEADLQLFRLAMEVADLSDILSDPKVHVAVGRDLEFLEQTISHFPFESFSDHPFLPAMSLHPEFYDAVVRIHDQHLYKTRVHRRGKEPAEDGMSLAKGVEILLDELRGS